MKPRLSITADLKLLQTDENSDYSRIFEIRDNPIQERQGQNNRCFNRNPSIARISKYVLKFYYCPGTNTPGTYLINLEDLGIGINEWFNVVISVSKKAEDKKPIIREPIEDDGKNNLKQNGDGAVEQSESYKFEIRLIWQNVSFTVPNTPYEFQNAKMTTNADLYIYKRPNVQVRNFESTGMKFIANNPSFW